jgi:hypothetical protein
MCVRFVCEVGRWMVRVCVLSSPSAFLLLLFLHHSSTYFASLHSQAQCAGGCVRQIEKLECPRGKAQGGVTPREMGG